MTEQSVQLLALISEQLRDSEARQLDAQDDTTEAIHLLTYSFKQFFKAERRDKESDDLEQSREEARNQKGMVSKKESLSDIMDLEQLDFGQGGFLRMIGGNAVEGLLFGVATAFSEQISQITASISKFFKGDILTRAIGRQFKKLQFKIRVFFVGNNGILPRLEKFFARPLDFFKKSFDFLKGGAARLGAFFFSGITTMFDPIIEPFKNLANVLKGAMSNITSGTGFFAKTLRGLGKFFGTFFAIGKALFVPIQIVVGAISGLKGFFKGFEEFKGNKLQKRVAGILGGITSAINALFMIPFDLIKGAVSYIAGIFGPNIITDILDSFSFADIFTKFMDKVIFAFTSIFEGLDLENMGFFDKFFTILKRLLRFPAALAKGSLAAISNIFGDPIGAFKKEFSHYLHGGAPIDINRESVPDPSTAPIEPPEMTGIFRPRKLATTGLTMKESLERADAIAASRKESRETVIIDNSTNNSSSSQGDSLVLTGNLEPAINIRKQSRG